ncbi:hypothetical protein Slala02_31680 [Streptomyces lavendulae subsp. lavendulae]|nr:hypothetical protein Slala02_31680 [Streptomyces lavendulae subsp. lavendulae]
MCRALRGLIIARKADGWTSVTRPVSHPADRLVLGASPFETPDPAGGSHGTPGKARGRRSGMRKVCGRCADGVLRT